MNNYTNTVIPGLGTLLMFFIVMMGIFLAFAVFFMIAFDKKYTYQGPQKKHPIRLICHLPAVWH